MGLEEEMKMVNHTTVAQRYNARMEKIFNRAKYELPSSLNKFYWRNGKVVRRVK